MADDNDLEVRFGADIGDLSANSRKASEEISAVGRVAREAGMEGNRGLEHLLEGFKSLLEGIESGKASLEEFAALAAAAFAFKEVNEFAESMAELGHETEKASEILGVPTEQIGSLKLLAEASGISLESLTMMFGRLSRNIVEQSPETKRVLDGLHLSFNELGGSATQELSKLADTFSRFKDGPEKDAAAVELFGRAGLQMLPMLNEGSDAIREFGEMAERTGTQLSGSTTASMVELHHELTEMHGAWEGLGIAIYNEFETPLKAAYAIMIDWVEGLRQAISAGGSLKPVLDMIAESLQVVETGLSLGVYAFRSLATTAGVALNTVNTDFTNMGTMVHEVFVDITKGIEAFFEALPTMAKNAVKAIGDAFADLGQAIMSGIRGDFAGAEAAASQANAALSRNLAAGIKDGFDFSDVAKTSADSAAEIRKLWTDGDKAIKDDAEQTKRELDKIWSSPMQGPVRPPGAGGDDLHIAPSSGGKKGKSTAGRDAEQAYQTEVEQAQLAEEKIQTGLDDRLKLHQITMQDWAKQSVAALEIEKTAIEAAGQQALSNAALTSQQKVTLKNEEQRKLAEIDKKISEDETKAAEATMKQYQQVADTIMGAFNSAFRGMVTGHETFAKAVTKSLEDLGFKFLDMVEKMVEKWILGQLMMTTATTTGAATREAAEQTANAGSIGTMIANALRAVTVDAGQTAAGVTAFLAPVMGPAAIGAGTAAGGTVLGMAAMDIGAWNLPSDQIAMVHKNELVMPAAEAGAFRSMLTGGANGGGGGGAGVAVHPTTNFHISALDGASVGSWARQNGPAMLKAVNEAVRQGAALGLRGIR